MNSSQRSEWEAGMEEGGGGGVLTSLEAATDNLEFATTELKQKTTKWILGFERHPSVMISDIIQQIFLFNLNKLFAIEAILIGHFILKIK